MYTNTYFVVLDKSNYAGTKQEQINNIMLTLLI